MQLQQQVVDANGYEIDGVSGSTVAIDANFDAIQNHVNGMSIAGTEALAAGGSPGHAISGPPLVDPAGSPAPLRPAAQECPPPPADPEH